MILLAKWFLSVNDNSSLLRAKVSVVEVKTLVFISKTSTFVAPAFCSKYKFTWNRHLTSYLQLLYCKKILSITARVQPYDCNFIRIKVNAGALSMTLMITAKIDVQTNYILFLHSFRLWGGNQVLVQLEPRHFDRS